MKRADQILIGLMGAMAVVLIWIVVGTLEPPLIVAGDNAPSFTVVTDQGNRISPTRFDGKLLVLNLWATWCAGCVQETRSLDAFQKVFASQGVVVLAVSMDKSEKQYRQFLQQFRIGFATTRDPEWNISASYGTFQLPETYIINRSGKVIEKIIAAYDFMNPDFQARIRRML